MSEVSKTAKPRRADTERAFAHLASIASSVDLSGVSDPLQQWVIATRASVARYSDVGEKPSLAGVRFTSVSANGVPALWAVAEGGSSAHRIVWLHGGGWSAGSPEDYRPLAAMLARLSGASVLMPDYRLAPEHKFPAGLDDCTRAFAWAVEHGPEQELADGASERAKTLTLIGDSAGGNLAAATCLKTISDGGHMPDRLVLIAGTLDNTPNPERVGLDDPICTPETLGASVASYLRKDDSPTNLLVSPVYASDEMLEKFPPTLIQVSSTEALLFDSKRFSQRLEQAGIRVSLSIWPGLPHIWHALAGVFTEAEQAVKEIADFARP